MAHLVEAVAAVRDPGDEDDGPLAELDRHRASCRDCRPWTPCRVAADMLQRMTNDLAAKMAPIPVKPGEA